MYNYRTPYISALTRNIIHRHKTHRTSNISKRTIANSVHYLTVVIDVPREASRRGTSNHYSLSKRNSRKPEWPTTRRWEENSSISTAFEAILGEERVATTRSSAHESFSSLLRRWKGRERRHLIKEASIVSKKSEWHSGRAGPPWSRNPQVAFNTKKALSWSAKGSSSGSPFNASLNKISQTTSKLCVCVCICCRFTLLENGKVLNKIKTECGG